MFPAALAIARERVKPYRDALKPTALSKRLQERWWQFYSQREGLQRALAPLRRCLVTAQTTKHLAFSFHAPRCVFSVKSYVAALSTWTAFSALQSRLHENWSRKLSSTLGDTLSYSSGCFETFPFPKPDPRTVIPALEDIGQRLYDLRAKYMVDDNVGLTITYNRLKDPSCTEPRILELRNLHEEMDRQVLAAYADGDPEGRWLDLEVPPYCPLNDAEKKKLEAFEDGVIDRLFVLNGKRAEAERIAGLAGEKGKRGNAKKKDGAEKPDAGAKAKGGPRAGGAKGGKAGGVKKGKKPGSGQLALGASHQPEAEDTD
jgi:hypothetical protein